MRCAAAAIALCLLRKLAKWSTAPSTTTVHSKVPKDALLRTAELSELAYEHPDTSEALQSLSRRGHLEFFDAQTVEGSDECTQAFAYLEEGSSDMFLFFRGTESRRDALTNLDVRRRTVGGECGALVHRGFLRQFQAIEEKLTEFLDRHQCRYSTLTCCGHSLGGALATIAAVYYSTRSREEESMAAKNVEYRCHTFGCPRLGNRQFASLFQTCIEGDKHWRVFDYEDPVPMIPASCRFHHVKGYGLCLGEEGRLRKVELDTPWPLRPLNSVINLQVTSLVSSHEMHRYVCKLRRLFTRSGSEDDKCEAEDEDFFSVASASAYESTNESFLPQYDDNRAEKTDRRSSVCDSSAVTIGSDYR